MPASPLLIREIDRRTPARGMLKGLAADWGVSQAHLTGLRNGSAKLGSDVAARVLAKVRAEDLVLANKIEAELCASWRAELRRIYR